MANVNFYAEADTAHATFGAQQDMQHDFCKFVPTQGVLFGNLTCRVGGFPLAARIRRKIKHAVFNKVELEWYWGFWTYPAAGVPQPLSVVFFVLSLAWFEIKFGLVVSFLESNRISKMRLFFKKCKYQRKKY